MTLTILCASDRHRYDNSLISVDLNFRSLVETMKPDILIMGEWNDPWKAPWSQIIQTTSFKITEEMLRQRWLQGKTNIYLRGNHDWNASAKEIHYCEIVSRYRVEDILFMHGWEFAFDWWIIHPFAFWIADKHPEWMVPIYNFLYGKQRSPGALKRHDTLEDWNKQIGLIHLRAMDYAQKHKIRLVIQHTHCPYESPILWDSGDMLDSFSYIWIANDKIELKYV